MRPSKLLPFLFLVTIANSVLGQRLELSTSFNTGLFYYGGQSATSSTIADISYPPVYIENPYGRSSGLSYGISLQLQQATSKHFIYGLQIGYELLSSKADLYEVLSEEPVYTWDTSQSFVTLSNEFINLNPYVGHRIERDKLTVDLIAGTDFGFCVNSQAKVDATNSEGANSIVKVYRDEINLDIRPRIGATCFYNNYGVSIGYSFGVSNYSKAANDPDDKIYSRYLRFGLAYRMHM